MVIVGHLVSFIMGKCQRQMRSAWITPASVWSSRRRKDVYKRQLIQRARACIVDKNCPDAAWLSKHGIAAPRIEIPDQLHRHRVGRVYGKAHTVLFIFKCAVSSKMFVGGEASSSEVFLKDLFIPVSYTHLHSGLSVITSYSCRSCEMRFPFISMRIVLVPDVPISVPNKYSMC